MVHDEDDAIVGLRERLALLVDPARLHARALDETWELTAHGAVRAAQGQAPRLAQDQIARLDRRNDASKLILDINDALKAEADDKARAVLIRRLMRALEGA